MAAVTLRSAVSVPAATASVGGSSLPGSLRTQPLRIRPPSLAVAHKKGAGVVLAMNKSNIHTLSAGVATSLTFQFEETSFSVQFDAESAKKLQESIDKLLQTFREKEKATRPQRWESLEFRYNTDGVFMEIFCNPNAYSNAFQAKALVTIKGEKMRLSTEGPLSNVKSSVEEYLASL